MKKTLSLILSLIMVMSVITVARADENTLWYSGNKYVNDVKEILLNEDMDNTFTEDQWTYEVDSQTVDPRMSEGGVDGTQYVHITNAKQFYDKLSFLRNAQVKEGGLVVFEMDYRVPDTMGGVNNNRMYIDVSGQNPTFGEMRFLNDGELSVQGIDIANGGTDRVTISLGKFATNTWHHLKWGFDYDNLTFQVFVDDDYASPEIGFKEHADVAGRNGLNRVWFRIEPGSKGYIDIDNMQACTIDAANPYEINSMTYAGGATSPSAEAVLESVKITQNKIKNFDTKLVVAVYDDKGVVNSVQTQALTNDDFASLGEASEIALDKPVELPKAFNENWQVKAFVWAWNELCPMSDYLVSKTFFAFDAPVAYQIAQMDEEGEAQIALNGSIFADGIKNIEARAVKNELSVLGEDTDWTAVNATETSFDGTITAPAGGWYTVEIRGLLADGTYAYASVDNVGVGNVFAIDDNSTAQAESVAYNTMSVYDGEWMPMAEAKIAASWVELANEIGDNSNIPVAFVKGNNGQIETAATLAANASADDIVAQYCANEEKIYTDVDGSSLMFFNNFDDQTHSAWAGASTFSIREGGADGTKYGFLKGDFHYNEKFNTDGNYVARDGVVVFETDFKADQTVNNKTWLRLGSNYHDWAYFNFQPNGVFAASGSLTPNPATDARINIGEYNQNEWNHLRVEIDMDNNTNTVYINDDDPVTVYRKPRTYTNEFLYQIIMRSEPGNGASDGQGGELAFDNMYMYHANISPDYAVNALTYANGKLYPVANDALTSVNVAQLKRSNAYANLKLSVYNSDDVLVSSYTQPIAEGTFTEMAKEAQIELTTPFAIPADFAAGWKIVANVEEAVSGEVVGSKTDEYKIVLSNPTSRKVFQRNDENVAQVKIEGTLLANNVSKLEARAVLSAEAEAGEDVDWTPIAYDGTQINGELTLQGGGWYQLDVRATLSDDSVIETSVDKVGAGEIFIVTGQSNSTAAGTGGARTTEDDRVTMYDTQTDSWLLFEDAPSTYAANSGANQYSKNKVSAWSFMAEKLIQEIKVPIAYVSLGWGARSVNTWDPVTGSLYAPVLKEMLKLGPNGFRAVLFHQGEQDSTHSGDTNGTRENTYKVYKAQLEKNLAAFRRDSGWADMPWVIAQVSVLNKEGTFSDAQAPYCAMIPQAQRDICAEDPYTYLGPNTDLLIGQDPDTGNWYRNDVHFNFFGSKVHGEMWADCVMEAFFTEAE